MTAGKGRHIYAVALGSNRPHHHYGAPRNVINAAIEALGEEVVAVSPLVQSLPVGPSRRLYANVVVLLESEFDPPTVLRRLKRIERGFGRRRGRRWSARTLDLDIVLWSGGIWADRALTIPHPGFRQRRFVLAPLSVIAPRWRDPLTGMAVAHLRARLDRPRPRS